MAKSGTKKPPKKKSVAAPAPRMRKLTRKQARGRAKNDARRRSVLPNSFKLTAQVFRILTRFWKPLGGIILVYLILNVVFASGISSLNSTVSSIKADLNNTGIQAHPLYAGLTGFLTLIGSAGSSSSSTGTVLQAILILLESLVIIWALRQLTSGSSIKIKQAYYQSMSPLVPFLLVICWIFIQLLPVSFGSAILAAIVSSLGTISGFWTVVFSGILILLAAWSVYMISASIFGLYIVTLPDMPPRKALRSARNLVRFRRWPVIRRVLFLPLLLVVVMGVIIIPLILYATFLVTPVFYLLSTLALLFAHAYLYSLYRGLLG